MQQETTSAETPTEAKNPRVSIIIPAYKVAQFISETLDSVFAQTFKDYEVIIVNDGSPDTDELERALEPFMAGVVYLKQENSGAGAARNRALRAARGELVAFLDADDIWLPEFLEEQVEFLEKGNYDLVYADALLFGDSPTAGMTYMQTTPSRGEINFKSMVHYECNFITSAVVARKSLIFEVGLFDVTLRNGQDFDLWLKLVRGGARANYQRKVLLRQRCHSDSLSTTDPVDKIHRQIRLFKKIDDNYDLSAEERAEVAYVFRKLEAELDYETGKAQFLAGDFKSARQNLQKANHFQRNWRTRVILMLLSVAPRLTRRFYLRRMGIS